MLKDEIESFTSSTLSAVKIEKVRAPKIIRDALTQTATFPEYEINIINLPVVQRLRRVHQTALAMLTYPCAIHVAKYPFATDRGQPRPVLPHEFKDVKVWRTGERSVGGLEVDNFIIIAKRLSYCYFTYNYF